MTEKENRSMPAYRVLFDMGLALGLAISISGVLSFVYPEIASTAGGVIAAAYFFSRYPWGGRTEANEELDAFFDKYLPF